MQEVVRRCDVPVKRRGEMTPCGEHVPDAFSFAVEGVAYEADLCVDHRQKFTDAVDPFIAIADVVTQRSASHAVRTALKGRKGTFTTKDVRRWLQEQGREVAPSGRLPNELIEEYRLAHTS